MQETWVRFLVWEDPLEKEQQPTPVLLPRESHEQKNLAGYSPWGFRRVGHNLATRQQQQGYKICRARVFGVKEKRCLCNTQRTH